MSTKTLSIALFFFTALTLTHAAFVNYRSGAAETQPQYRTEGTATANQMLYLQQRKFAGPELVLGNYGDYDRRSIWRGLIKSRWTENGLCCGVFELLVKMKGGRTRETLLRLLSEPRNKLQLAQELDIDWKAVDGHISKLLNFNLVQEVALVGTCKVYSITQKGKRALELLDQMPGSECG